MEGSEQLLGQLEQAVDEVLDEIDQPADQVVRQPREGLAKGYIVLVVEED